MSLIADKNENDLTEYFRGVAKGGRGGHHVICSKFTLTGPRCLVESN